MLRRIIAAQVLDKAQNKYYKYAVSDVKLSLEYGAQVTDWQNSPDNDEFLQRLVQLHRRKASFMALLEEAGIV